MSKHRRCHVPSVGTCFAIVITKDVQKSYDAHINIGALVTHPDSLIKFCQTLTVNHTFRN